MADTNMYSKMQEGDPIAVYKKAVLGRVEVDVLNPFDETKHEKVMLKGNPKTNDDGSFVEVWSTKQMVFFDRSNKPLLTKGYLTKLATTKKPEPIVETKSYEDFGESEIKEMVMAPFLKFKHMLNELDSEAVLFRVLSIAEEMERPEKTMQHIRQRLTEIQQGD